MNPETELTSRPTLNDNFYELLIDISLIFRLKVEIGTFTCICIIPLEKFSKNRKRTWIDRSLTIK